MPAEIVVDASVLGSALFNEARSQATIDLLLTGPRLIAPELLIVEMASIGAKKVWRREATAEVAQKALLEVRRLVDEFTPCAPLAAEALAVAADHKLSAYDAFYVTLARRRGLPLVTLDRRLMERVRSAGLEVSAVEPGDL